MRVVVVLLVVIVVTGGKQSQLLVLGLRLEFDNNFLHLYLNTYFFQGHK